MISIKSSHNNWTCYIIQQVIFQLLESMRVRRASVKRVRTRRARVRRVTRVSLSHSQRDLVAQEMGVMHQVSWSSSVSTFCRNEIKDRNQKSIQQHYFHFLFFFRKRMVAPPYARCHFCWEFSTAPPPPKSQQGQRVTPIKIIIAPPLGQL